MSTARTPHTDEFRTPPPLLDIPPEARPDRPDAWLVLHRALQLAGGAVVFVVVFAREATLRSLRREPDALMRALGAAMRVAFTRLGATFIKVGQIASTRGDLLPRALTDELARLQDSVPAERFADIRARLELELGGPIEDHFEHFDETPIAAASVAQVHRATLPAGEQLAVKVRRPGITRKVHLDRSILLYVSQALERIVPSLRLVSLPEAVATFCDAVEAQLSMRTEAANNLRFTAMFADDDEIEFPRIHESLCTDAVLVMDFIDGCHERDLDDTEYDLARVVDAGMRAVSRMIFEHGFVHADLHPGNLLFRAPSTVVMLDLGLVGDISDEDRITTVRLFYALATGDGRSCARIFYENAPHASCDDYAAYEAEVEQMVSDVVGSGLMNLQVTGEIARIFDILRRHRVQARAHMTMVNLALMTAEGLGKRLAPDFNLTQEALPHLQQALLRAQQEGRTPAWPPQR